MSFSVKKLRKKSKVEVKKDRKFMLQMGFLLGGVMIVFFLSFAIYKIIKSIDFSTVIFSSFSTPLQEDDTGKINILLLGVGGEQHDGPNLTDTLMIAHIDPRQKNITMLSIPRDLYIVDQVTGGVKINAIYDAGLRKYGPEQGMEGLIQTIEEMTDLSIPYYLKVDFNGFVEIVDSLGGVEVDVEKRIYDSQYPLGYGYQVFKLEEGRQTLDGDTALKYARSRHGQGNERGDYDRAERQQQLLYALKEKALRLNILSDVDKLKELYNAFQNTIQTNLSLPELLALAQIAQELERDTIYPLVFNDDTQNCGGLLYAPPREYYGGAVTLPVGEDYTYLQLFAQHVVPNISTIQQAKTIHVANGTKVTGLALETANMLSRFCFPDVSTGNASDQAIDTSVIYYNVDKEGNPPFALSIVQSLLLLPIQEGIPQEYLSEDSQDIQGEETKDEEINEDNTETGDEDSTTDPNIVIELGQDYLQIRADDPFRLF